MHINSLFVILALSVSLTAFAPNQIQHEGFGLDFAYLDAMSNEELLALYAPFAAIIDEFNVKYGLCAIQYGIEMIISDPDCDLQRPFLINAISSSTLEEFRVNTIEHAHVLVDLKRLNAVSKTLWNVVEETYPVDGVDMFDELLNLTNMITADVEILNQVYELLENDVTFFELIEIIGIVDIELPRSEIDPLQTTVDEKIVVLEALGIVLDFGDPIPETPQVLDIEPPIYLGNGWGSSSNINALRMPWIRRYSPNVDIKITEADLEIIFEFAYQVISEGRPLGFDRSFTRALEEIGLLDEFRSTITAMALDQLSEEERDYILEIRELRNQRVQNEK